jgi:hypothetical protein
MDSSIHTTTEITTEITTGSNNNNNKRSDNRPQQKDAPQAPSALDILELVEYAGRQGQEIDRHQAIDMIQMAGSLDAAKSRVDAISAPDKISRSGVHDKFVSK